MGFCKQQPTLSDIVLFQTVVATMKQFRYYPKSSLSLLLNLTLQVVKAKRYVGPGGKAAILKSVWFSEMATVRYQLGVYTPRRRHISLLHYFCPVLSKDY